MTNPVYTQQGRESKVENPLMVFSRRLPELSRGRPPLHMRRWARAAFVRALPAVLLTATLAAVCALLAHLGPGYLHSVSVNGDNLDYALIAGAIRSGHFEEIETVIRFWGLPYAVALAGLILHVGAYPAIALISVVSILASAGLVAVLWSRRVAAYFVVTNYTFLQFGVFGGAESLFLALLLFSLWVARRGHWGWAAVIAAAATTLRPLGCLALLAYGVSLLHQRRYKSALAATVGGSAVLVLYCLPLYIHFGDPLANFHGYQSTNWNHGWPITFPFAGIIANFRTRANIHGPIMLGAKVAYVVAHVTLLAGALGSRERRMRLFLRPQEGVFVCLYSAFMFLYHAPEWALSIYPRLLLPVSPMLLDVYRVRLPRSRALVAALGLLAVLFTCGTSFGLPPLLAMLGLTKLFRP